MNIVTKEQLAVTITCNHMHTTTNTLQMHSVFSIESALGHLNAEGKFIVAVPSEQGNESNKQPGFFS